jgi:hypothetical protein
VGVFTRAAGLLTVACYEFDEVPARWRARRFVETYEVGDLVERFAGIRSELD